MYYFRGRIYKTTEISSGKMRALASRMRNILRWKRGRVVEGTGLENRQGATLREFESHRFRQNDIVFNDLMQDFVLT